VKEHGTDKEQGVITNAGLRRVLAIYRSCEFQVSTQNSARNEATGILFVNRKHWVWPWLLVLTIVLIAVGCALWLDPIVHRWMVDHQDRATRKFFNGVSRFGDWPAHVALGLALLAIAWWRGKKRWTRIFLSMLIACALAGVTARVIKIATGRARPSVKTEEVWAGPRLSEKFHAFPSGHTAASTAFFAVLFLANWRIGLACLPIPFTIAISRVYLGAHYLSDVVCAAVLGLICALLVTRLVVGRQIEKNLS
jgi:undecaprenyl-diphosphatase